ncbi:unnamed protein product [Allacma fusca]|uniref:C2H2-type domain-containing protein n=1 Tax=Allacma fusca TaxID=39272 RepID=A0A8J2P0N7_9HEXA|nr:unnamed protein product [Allacma fusca]
MEGVLCDKTEFPVPDIAEMIEVEFRSDIRDSNEMSLPEAEILSDSSDDESNHETAHPTHDNVLMSHSEVKENDTKDNVDLEIIFQRNAIAHSNIDSGESSTFKETYSEMDFGSNMDNRSFHKNPTDDVQVIIKTEDYDDISCEIIGEYPPRGETSASDSESPSQSEDSLRSTSVIQWAGSTQTSKEEMLDNIPVITIGDDDDPAEVTVHIKHLYPSMYHIYRCICCDGLIGHRRIRRLQTRVSPHDLSEYRYQCTSCGNGYVTERQLKRHLTRHGEKKFGCCKCDKKFCTHRELQSHAVVHTTDRPFPCPHCAQSFRQSSSYYSHLKSHIICEICSAERIRV